MSKELETKATILQIMTCLNSLLDRANHDEYLARIGKKEALKFLEENEKYADIIKSALQRLESIDNANPSEALRELNIIRHLEIGFDKNGKPITINDIDGLNTIKQALLKAQEQEKVIVELCEHCGMDNLYPYDNLEEIEITFKDTFDNYQLQRITSLGRLDKLGNENAELKRVLEILFKKQVDLGWLWYCIHECIDSLNEYNKKMPIEKFKLTQEEFDLLKRCFE